MKKFVLSAIVVVLMSAGLVSASSTTASAARYPGSIETVTNASSQGAKNRNQRPKLRVAVRAVESNRRVFGPLIITYIHKDGFPSFTYTRKYSGRPQVYGFPALRKSGQWIVSVRYQPGGTSAFIGSTGQARQFVRNKPRVRR